MAPLSASPRGLSGLGRCCTDTCAHMHAYTHARTHKTSSFFFFFFFLPHASFSLYFSLFHSLPPTYSPPQVISLPPSLPLLPPIYSPLFLSVPCSRLCRLVSLPGDGIMKNAPIDRAPQLRLAEMGHDRPRSILIPSYNVSTNESISAKFSIFQKPTRETGISSFVKILLSISSAI